MLHVEEKELQNTIDCGKYINKYIFNIRGAEYMGWIFLKESKIWWSISSSSYKYKNKQTIIHRSPFCFRCKNCIPDYYIESWKDIENRHGYYYDNKMYCKFCFDIFSKKNIANFIRNREIK